jgi:hypothetical protein
MAGINTQHTSYTRIQQTSATGCLQSRERNEKQVTWVTLHQESNHSQILLTPRTYASKRIQNTAEKIQYTDQEMIPARNARNVVTLAEVMVVTIQRENILPSKITDYWLTNAHELLTTEWLKY